MSLGPSMPRATIQKRNHIEMPQIFSTDAFDTNAFVEKFPIGSNYLGFVRGQSFDCCGYPRF